jgi:hypothetical protein
MCIVYIIVFQPGVCKLCLSGPRDGSIVHRVPRKTGPSLVKYKSTYSRKTLRTVQTKIWQMTLFQNLILFTNHYRNLKEMLEMAFFLEYVDLYLTSEWDRFYVRHPVLFFAVLLQVSGSLLKFLLPHWSSKHNEKL